MRYQQLAIAAFFFTIVAVHGATRVARSPQQGGVSFSEASARAGASAGPWQLGSQGFNPGRPGFGPQPSLGPQAGFGRQEPGFGSYGPQQGFGRPNDPGFNQVGGNRPGFNGLSGGGSISISKSISITRGGGSSAQSSAGSVAAGR